MGFKIGQKVVCINDSPGWIDGVRKLVKGEIYEILYVSDKDLWVIPGDAGWDKSRFRLLDYEFAENLLSEIKKQVKTQKQES